MSEESELPLTVDGSHLTLDEIVAVARRGDTVRVEPAARERVEASHVFADGVAEDRPIYGRSTGVGANKEIVQPDPDSQALQLLRSHATSSGELRSAERVRAMLVIRLNQLAADGNGISPEVLDALEADARRRRPASRPRGRQRGHGRPGRARHHRAGALRRAVQRARVPRAHAVRPGRRPDLHVEQRRGPGRRGAGGRRPRPAGPQRDGHRRHGLRGRAGQRRGVQPGRRGGHPVPRLAVGVPDDARADRSGAGAGPDPGPVQPAHLPPGARRADGPAGVRRAGRRDHGQQPVGEPDRLPAARGGPPRRLPRGVPRAVAGLAGARRGPVGPAQPGPADDAGRAGVHRTAPVPRRRDPGGVRA